MKTKHKRSQSSAQKAGDAPAQQATLNDDNALVGLFKDKLKALSVPEKAWPCPSLEEIMAATGAQSALHAGDLFSQAVHASFTERERTANTSKPYNADALTLEAIKAIGPKDGLEGMLAVQMVGIHGTTMRLLGDAGATRISQKTVEANLKLAAKLMRTFTAQVEALNRHRGKGQQKVVVEHVTVHSGGQAIVGAVESPRGVGGSHEK